MNNCGAFIGVLTAVVGAGIVGTPFYFMHQDDIRREQAERVAPFHKGDIVKSRVMGFRGMVTGLRCQFTPCEYWVRFYGQSSEEISVNGFEIEPIP